MDDERTEKVWEICRGILPTFERDEIVSMILDSELSLRDLSAVKSIEISNLTSENTGARYPAGLSYPESGTIFLDSWCLGSEFGILTLGHEIGHILYWKRGLRLSPVALSRISPNWGSRFKNMEELTVDAYGHAIFPRCIPDIYLIETLHFMPSLNDFVTNTFT